MAAATSATVYRSGLVVVIGVMPDDFAKLQVVKLHVEIEAGDNTTGADFPNA